MLTSFIFKLIHQHTTGLIHLCAINVAAGKWEEGVFTDKEDIACNFINKHIETKDLFFSVSTFKDASSRKASNTLDLSCVHADLDFKDYEGGADEADQILTNFCERYKVWPTAIVSSGYGYHVYWVLWAPLRLETDEIKAKAGRVIQAIQKELHADSTRDLARIYRIPSTLNHKHGRQVECILLTHPLAKTKYQYQWAAFEKIAEKLDVSINEGVSTVAEYSIDTSWTDKKCIQAICYKGLKEGERNKAFVRIVSELQKKGMGEAYVREYCNQVNAKATDAYGEDALQTCITNALQGKYDYGCNDEFLREHCNQACKYRNQGYTDFDAIEVYSIPELLKELNGHAGKTILGMSTGIDNLDALTDGIRGLWVVGGPSKSNKSTFCLHLALQQALSGSKVLIIDRELSEKIVLCRIMSYLWGRNVEDEAKIGGLLENSDFIKVVEDVTALQSSIKIISTRCPTQEEIKSLTTSVINKNEKLILVVDSINKLNLNNIAPTRREAIDIWLLFFESLAKDYGVPVLLVSEITKAARDNPQAGDFAESRQHDYACNQSLMITKPSEDTRELHVLEGRNAKGSGVIKFRLPEPFAWRLEEVKE